MNPFGYWLDAITSGAFWAGVLCTIFTGFGLFVLHCMMVAKN